MAHRHFLSDGSTPEFAASDTAYGPMSRTRTATKLIAGEKKHADLRSSCGIASLMSVLEV
jgi:hypothetical protein